MVSIVSLDIPLRTVDESVSPRLRQYHLLDREISIAEKQGLNCLGFVVHSGPGRGRYVGKKTFLWETNFRVDFYFETQEEAALFRMFAG